MLDLTTVTKSKKLYEIKMPDGQVLTLKMPTQKLLMKLVDMQKNLEDPMTAISQLVAIVTEIFNLNTQGKKFTDEDVESMLDLNTVMLVIKDYFETTTKTLGE